MKKQKVTDIFLYRWRYVFGYTLLALLYIGAIIISALHVPGGLSQAEIDMVNTTNHLNFSVEGIAITNLPFHLLQLLFFKLFGVGLLTIKAPAVILSIASSVAIHRSKRNCWHFIHLLHRADFTFRYIDSPESPERFHLANQFGYHHGAQPLHSVFLVYQSGTSDHRPPAPTSTLFPHLQKTSQVLDCAVRYFIRDWLCD